MKFTDQLWQRITPVYDSILELPFIEELAEGILPQETFLFYMQQDTLYLSDYSRALSLAGIRSDDNEQMRQFLDFATNAISVEQALHGEFFKRFGVEEGVKKSPACLAYTSFLLSTAALKPNAVGIASLLPCFWIYRQVGMHIYHHTANENPYQDWIETYAGEEFKKGVEKAIAITNKAAEKASESRLRDMEDAFVRSSQLEWMFWESAYRREQWPVQAAESISV